MELIPAQYQCSDDGQDLTALVEEKLAERDPYTFSPKSNEFRVIVTCPGTGATHRVGVSGQVRYER